MTAEPQDTAAEHPTPDTPPAAPDHSTAYKTGTAGAVLFVALLVVHIPHWADTSNWAPPTAMVIFGMSIVAVLFVLARVEWIAADQRHHIELIDRRHATEMNLLRTEVTCRIDALNNQVVDALNHVWFHGWGTGVKDAATGEISDNVVPFPRSDLGRHA